MIASGIGWMKRRPGVAAVLLLAAISVGIFGLVFFEPQKLFIDQRVNEAIPTAPALVGDQTAPASEQIASSMFRDLEHDTNGSAILTESPDGSRILSLVDFETSNGPDLRVYLSAGSSDKGFGKEYGEDFVELGRLKGNIGDQNYDVPAEIDLAKYHNAVIWCKRFSVGFGVATFETV